MQEYMAGMDTSMTQDVQDVILDADQMFVTIIQFSGKQNRFQITCRENAPDNYEEEEVNSMMELEQMEPIKEDPRFSI